MFGSVGRLNLFIGIWEKIPKLESLSLSTHVYKIRQKSSFGC